MSRRIVVLVFSLVVFIGTTAMLAPPASSADTSWTTLSRHCWRIEYRGDRLRTCVSIRGRLVDERVMIRTRCRVKMLTFETETIWLQNCMLVKEFDYEVVASVPETQRSGVTGAIVKTPLVACDPTADLYTGYFGFSFYFPDGEIGSYGIGTEWWTPCSFPA